MPSEPDHSRLRPGRTKDVESLENEDSCYDSVGGGDSRDDVSGVLWESFSIRESPG